MNKRLGLLFGVMIACSSATWAAEKEHGVKVVSPDRFHLDAGDLSLGLSQVEEEQAIITPNSNPNRLFI